MIRGSPRGGFVLADFREHSVSEYSPSGELLWRFGRRGEGPGEFSAIVDLEFDASGNLLVLDRAMRVTVINPSGTLVDTKHTPAGNQILPTGFSSGWATLALDRTETLWGSASRRVPMPSGVSFTSSIVGERWAANAPDGEAVVFHLSSDNQDENVATIKVRTRGRDATSARTMAVAGERGKWERGGRVSGDGACVGLQRGLRVFPPPRRGERSEPGRGGGRRILRGIGVG